MPKARITLAEIARRVGVSRAVVGRVLLGSGADVIRVAEDTAERIRSTAAELGYRPNRSAQQLAGGRSHALGLVMAQQAPMVTYCRLAAIERTAARHGLRVVIGRFDEADPALLDDYLDDFAGRHLDGVIFIDHYQWSRRTVAKAVARLDPIPVVFQSQAELPPKVSRVRLDLRRGAVLAVEHLLARGHRRIGLAINGGPQPSHAMRRDGFVAACRAGGLEVDPRWIWTPPQPRAQLTEQEVTALLRQCVDGRKVTALVTENDYWAMQLIGRLERGGLRVPGRIAVVGYNNLEVSGLVPPALTTLDENHEAVAGHLLRLLSAEIQARGARRRRPAPEEVFVSPTLIVRESA